MPSKGSKKPIEHGIKVVKNKVNVKTGKVTHVSTTKSKATPISKTEAFKQPKKNK